MSRRETIKERKKLSLSLMTLLPCFLNQEPHILLLHWAPQIMWLTLALWLQDPSTRTGTSWFLPQASSQGDFSRPCHVLVLGLQLGSMDIICPFG